MTPKVIHSVAPIRICDCGGWTDTWFARYGAVFNIGVSPFVEVQVEAFPRGALKDSKLVNAENYGQTFVPSTERSHHPLIEAAIERMHVPEDMDIRVSIFSEMPPGASTGTSASVTVALVAALSRLTQEYPNPYELAELAFDIETTMLGRQSGIQDQFCAAFGGLNYIEINEYPKAVVTRLNVPDEVWWELEHRLLLIYLGHTHDSSQTHQMVIRHLEDSGPETPELKELRRCAAAARDAVVAGNLPALGQAMTANTKAQERLHSRLLSDEAKEVIEIAKHYHAQGWKLNGAGGEGGSMTILADQSMPAKRELIRALREASPLFQNIPTRLSRLGTRVWMSGTSI